MKSQNTKIGTVRLTKTTEFLDRGYECAAWWQTVRCEPQTVDVYLSLAIGTACLCYGFNGAVVDADFTSHFGGNAFGRYDKSQHVGRAASYGIHPYAYSILSAAFEGKFAPEGMEFALDPALVGVIANEFDHKQHGGIKTHYYFVPRGEMAERLEEWGKVEAYLNVREVELPGVLMGAAELVS